MNRLLKYKEKGMLLLAFMVFVALVGLGALMVIPPVEKEGRSVLEKNYTNSLKNYYRALHDYLSIESYYAGMVNTALSTEWNNMDTFPVPGNSLNDTEEILSITISNNFLLDMVDKGYITERMMDKDNMGFPDTTGSMTWEILLIPIY